MTTTVGQNPQLDSQNNRATFIQSIFTVKLTPSLDGADSNGDFSTYASIIGFSAMTDTGNGASPSNVINDPQIAQVLSQNGVPTYFYSKGKCRDTSIGGNDAINCYPQFNETDDVAEHPFLSTTIADDPTGLSGMGRVYSEVYDDQQQIMYLTFGVPKFNNLTSFYSNAILGDLAKLMNDGGQTTAGQIGELIGEGIGLFVTLPVLPLVFIYNTLQGITQINITKYYDFKSAMPLYYRIANSMLLHLSVNLGLVQDSFFLGQNPATQSSILDQTILESSSEGNANNLGTSTKGLPDVFQKYGFDIYRILLKKYTYLNGLDVSGEHTSDYVLTNSVLPDDKGVVNSDTGVQGFASDFISQFESQLYDANLFIGFRIEKGVDTSESFTNTTGESSIAQTVNSKIQSVRDAKFSLANGNAIGGIVGDFISGIGGVISGVADSTGLGGIDQILAGNGMIDFPEVWKDSSFNKNYNFNMSLRSPYGDPVSILQNLYFPLTLLLSGALPRAVGQASYTSPFICRAYCKGMFAIPLGMITSITVKRGADQFGWSTARLPTCIDISFEIKDLSPAMYLGITDSGTTLSALKQVFGANSNYQEYLMTLSGMGLAERISWIRQLRLKASYLLAQVNTTKLSPFYWGAAFGNTLPARIISNFVPVTKLPQN